MVCFLFADIGSGVMVLLNPKEQYTTMAQFDEFTMNLPT